jgi:carboxymethylenebutenolidase
MNGTSNGEEAPVPLPSAKPIFISETITINAPLSRRGTGPALVLLLPHGLDLSSGKETLDPPPLQKWAEEGYAVGQVLVKDGISPMQDVEKALDQLDQLKECDKTSDVGVIGETK